MNVLQYKGCLSFLEFSGVWEGRFVVSRYLVRDESSLPGTGTNILLALRSQVRVESY